MNKSKIKEIKVFYSQKNKNNSTPVSSTNLKTDIEKPIKTTFFNSVASKLKINNHTSKK